MIDSKVESRVDSNVTASWQQNDSEAVIVKEDTDRMYLTKGL